MPIPERFQVNIIHHNEHHEAMNRRLHRATSRLWTSPARMPLWRKRFCPRCICKGRRPATSLVGLSHTCLSWAVRLDPLCLLQLAALARTHCNMFIPILLVAQPHGYSPPGRHITAVCGSWEIQWLPSTSRRLSIKLPSALCSKVGRGSLGFRVGLRTGDQLANFEHPGHRFTCTLQQCTGNTARSMWFSSTFRPLQAGRRRLHCSAVVSLAECRERKPELCFRHLMLTTWVKVEPQSRQLSKTRPRRHLVGLLA